MRTKFPYEGTIDYDAYLDKYLEREDAMRRLPSDEELEDIVQKGLVKDQLVLSDVPQGTAAQTGDTVTLRTVSALPRFNKEKVTVSIGRGLYDKTLEAAVEGLKCGESTQVTVKDTPVMATVLEIRRKVVPTPTDDFARALNLKDFKGNPIETIDAYRTFIKEQKTSETLATVNYYVMEKILADYPMTEFDPEDIRILGELERVFMRNAILETDGVDVYTLSKEEMQERMHCDTFDDFIAMRYDWYKIKIQQCLTYLNILGLPCGGKTDPLDHYEVLSELTEKIYEKIKIALS